MAIAETDLARVSPRKKGLGGLLPRVYMSAKGRQQFIEESGTVIPFDIIDRQTSTPNVEPYNPARLNEAIDTKGFFFCYHEQTQRQIFPPDLRTIPLGNAGLGEVPLRGAGEILIDRTFVYDPTRIETFVVLTVGADEYKPKLRQMNAQGWQPISGAEGMLALYRPLAPTASPSL